MQIARCDEKGRINLKKKVVSRYGRDFVVIEAPNELVLIPVPDDPVKDLAEIGKPLRKLTLNELKERIRRRAQGEVLHGLRRH